MNDRHYMNDQIIDINSKNMRFNVKNEAVRA